MGSMNPLGTTVAETWQAMLAGRSGIAALHDGWAEALPVRIAGRVTADLGAFLGTRELKRMDRCGQLALVASREAWEQAGKPDVEPERFAVVIGSAYGGMDTVLAQVRELDNGGPRKVSPHTLTPAHGERAVRVGFHRPRCQGRGTHSRQRLCVRG
jgi:3-oxoacyl-[acyl-carrier-protein] synthase II